MCGLQMRAPFVVCMHVCMYRYDHVHAKSRDDPLRLKNACFVWIVLCAYIYIYIYMCTLVYILLVMRLSQLRVSGTRCMYVCMYVY